VTEILINTTDLAKLIEQRSVTLLDVRWALGDPHGREHYLAGHLPGARFVDLESELAAAPSAATDGRHPLPAATELEASARRWGVRRDRPVVCYDATGNLAAGRAWWLLRWAGLRDVRLLDGGLSAWTDAGLPLEQGKPEPIPESDVVLSAGHMPTLSAAEAERRASEGVLLDARAGERYRGESEPVDPRAGHIPGAVSAPTGENLTESGRFRTREDLRARFTAVGADGQRPVGVYCGSGVTAAHEVAALAIAGVDAALFPGSWSAWSSDPDRPVATGRGRG
jgi:thiosulfate/3-mercaptopyruvate sulfurtransferase